MILLASLGVTKNIVEHLRKVFLQCLKSPEDISSELKSTIVIKTFLFELLLIPQGPNCLSFKLFLLVALVISFFRVNIYI